MTLPGRAIEAHDGAAPCPVHPYGYHLAPRVNAGGSRTVFRDGSLLGLPSRCALLEEELQDSERELDLLDELWVRERSAGVRPLTSVCAALGSAAVVITALGDAGAGAVAAAAAAATIATLAGSRIDAALTSARLWRIRDWHRRVGVPR